MTAATARLAAALPPAALNALRRAFSEWTYLPGGWPAAGEVGDGWNQTSVVTAQERHWPTLVRNLEGTGPLGVSHHLRSVTREDRGDHNAMMAYGYVLARVARKKDRVSVLDWGGSLGHYYLYSRALLPEVDLDYHCHDVPRLCQAGRRLLPQARFEENGDEALARRYDLVVSSSSLHYFEDWRRVVRRLAAATDGYLYVARLQTVVRGPSYVVVQRPHRTGYRTRYPSWFLNRDEVVGCLADAGMPLVREFVYAEGWPVRGAPEQGDCRGFLFRRAGSAA